MIYRMIGEDGSVFDVPEENVAQALDYGTFYDSYDDFSLINPASSQRVSAPKKEVSKYINEGYRLDFSGLRPLKMVDAGTLDVFDIPIDRVKDAWTSGGRPSRSSKEPVTREDQAVVFAPPTGRVDNTGENYRLSAPKNFWDAVRNVGENPMSYVPFLNAVDVFDSAKLLKASAAVRNGTASDDQRNLVSRSTADAQRGTTWGYKVADMALRIPSFAIEFLSGGGILKMLGKKAVKETAEAAINAQGRRVAQAFAEGIGAPAGANWGAVKTVDQAVSLMVQGSKRDPGRVKEELLTRLASAGGLDSSSLSGSARFLSWLTEPVDETVGAVGQQVLKAGRAVKDKSGNIISPGKSASELLSEFGPQMGQAAVEQIKQAAASGLVRTVVSTPHRAINSTIVNMTPVFSLTPDQRGGMELALAEEGDGFGEAFLKGFGDTAIENFSESVGANFIFLRATAGKAAKDYVKAAALATSMDKIARKVAEKLPNTADSLKKSRKMVSDYLLGPDGNSGLISKLGWNGYFAELGEEAVGGALRQAFGISPVGLPSLEDVSAMAVAFLINPMALAASGHNSVLQRVAEAEAKSSVDLDKMLQAASSQGGVLTAEQNTLRETLEESIKTLAEKPKGIFGKLLYKAWTAPVENRKIQAIYKNLDPGPAGESFFEKAGLENSNETPEANPPSKQVFLAYLNAMADNLSLADSSERDQVNSDQVDRLLRSMGVYAARKGSDPAGVRKLASLVEKDQVSLAVEGARQVLRARLKPGALLKADEFKELRSSFPFLFNEVNISELKNEGYSNEEISALLTQDTIFSLSSQDNINTKEDLMFTLLYKGTPRVREKDWQPTMPEIRKLASIFGFLQNIESEAKIGATESQIRLAFNRRVEPIASTIRNATQTFGQTINITLGQVITGSGKDLVEGQEELGLGRDIRAYSRSLDPKGVFSIMRYGSYDPKSNGKTINVSVENLFSPEGIPTLVEEAGHALSMDSDGALFAGLREPGGFMSEVTQTLAAALNQEQQKNVRSSLRTVLKIAQASPHEFFVKWAKAEAGITSPTTPEEQAFADVAYLYKMTEQDYLELGRSLVAMGRGGRGTEGLQTEEAAKTAAANFKKLLVDAAQGVSSITAAQLGPPRAEQELEAAVKKAEAEKEAKRGGVKQSAVSTDEENPSPAELEKLEQISERIIERLGSKPDLLPEEAALRKKYPKTAKELDMEAARRKAGVPSRKKKSSPSPQVDRTPAEGEAPSEDEANRLYEIVSSVIQNLGAPLPMSDEDKALYKKFPKTNKKWGMEIAREIAKRRVSSSVLESVGVTKKTRETLLAFLDLFDKPGISLSSFNPEQMLAFASLIQEDPALLQEKPDEAVSKKRDLILKRMKSAQLMKARAEARSAGFQVEFHEGLDIFDTGSILEEEEDGGRNEQDAIFSGADENTYGNSLLARLVSLFPEGRERERDIVEFFGTDLMFKRGLERAALDTPEEWAKYLTSREFSTVSPASAGIREETARMLRQNELSVEDLRALAGLGSVRYVIPTALRIKEGKISFEDLGAGAFGRLRRRSASALSRIDTPEKLKTLLERVSSLIEIYEGEAVLNREFVGSRKELIRQGNDSEFEKKAAALFDRAFGVEPIFFKSGLFFSNAEQYPASMLATRRRNIKLILDLLETELAKGLTEEVPPARVTSALWKVLTETRGSKPSFIYQMVSPGNQQPLLLSEEEQKNLRVRISSPQRYRDPFGKLINAATRTNAIMRGLERRKLTYSTLVGGFASHPTLGTKPFGRKALTAEEVESASFDSWRTAIKKGKASYKLPLGVAASKEPMLLVDMPVPTGATLAARISSIKNSKSFLYAVEQIKALSELGVEASTWFPDLGELTAEISKAPQAALDTYKKLFKFQSALDRAYLRGITITSPAKLAAEVLRKRKKKVAVSPEDRAAVNEEIINESKRSSSFMTPQVGIPENIPGGFGKKMRVLLLEDPKYLSFAFEGDSGDRTDGWALWTESGLSKLRTSLGSVYSSPVTKGLHAGPNALFKESQAGLAPLAAGLIDELGAEAEVHPIVALQRTIDAMLPEDRPDIIRFTSAAKLGGKSRAVKNIWDYTPENSVRLKDNVVFTADQVFELPTSDFGLVGKADKKPVAKLEPIPTQWLPSNLGTSDVMSEEMEEFARLSLNQNLEPERLQAIARSMNLEDSAALRLLVEGVSYLPGITDKIESGQPLSIPELRRLVSMIGSKVADSAGKIKVFRGSSVNTPSFSYEYDGVAAETPVTDDLGQKVNRASRARANVINGRQPKVLSGEYLNENEAKKAAIAEILGKTREQSASGISYYRDLLTIFKRTAGGPAPSNLNEAYKTLVQKLVDKAKEEQVTTEAVEKVSYSLSKNRVPRGTNVRALIDSLSAQGTIDAVAGQLELHELDIFFGDSGKWKVRMPGSLLMMMRVPSPGQPAIFVARLNGSVGDGSTNQMILHPDDSARAGADFDIDTWYHFGPEKHRGSPGIGGDFRSTWLIRLAQGMLRDTTGFKERYTKTDPEAYRGFAREKVSEKIGQLKNPYYSWETQGKLRSDNLSVKRVVGIFAAGVRLINALRVRKLKFRQFGKRTAAELDRFVVSTETGSHEFVLGNVTEISPAAVSHFNTMLQMAVDNDKLLYLPSIGVNEYNAGFITAMFLFNPDLMRGSASKEDFQAYLKKVINYLETNPAPRYAFETKNVTKTASYFSREGRKKLMEVDNPFFKTNDWQLFSGLFHLSESLRKLGQVQNMTGRAPKNFFDYVNKVENLRSLSDPTGFSKEIAQGFEVSVDTFGALHTPDGSVSALFGKPNEMAALYRAIQFAADPVATDAADQFVSAITGEILWVFEPEFDMSIEKRKPTAAEIALKDRNIKFDISLQGAMDKALMNIFVAEAANRGGELLTRTPSSDSSGRFLNTRLIQRTEELQKQLPDNEFLLNIDAKDETGVGPALLKTLSLNLDPTDEAFASLRTAANSLPEDYLSELMVYSRLRWGNDTSSRNGNLAPLLPEKIESQFARATKQEQSAWSTDQLNLGKQLAEKYGGWTAEALQSGRPGPMFSDGAAAVASTVLDKNLPEEASSSALIRAGVAAAFGAGLYTAAVRAPEVVSRVTAPIEIKEEALVRTEVSKEDRDDWAERTRVHETFRAEVYPDSTKHPTVGYGYNMKDRNSPFDKARFKRITTKDFDRVFAGKDVLTKAEAERLLQEDLDLHFDKARRLYQDAKVPFEEWPAELKLAVADMVFMGALPKFPKTNTAIKEGDWRAASREIADTTYLNTWIQQNGPIELATMLKAPTVVRYRRARDIFASYEEILQKKALPAFENRMEELAGVAPDSRKIEMKGLDKESWPDDSNMKQRREKTSAQFERSEHSPFRTQVLRAFLTRENPSEPYFSRGTVREMIGFIRRYNDGQKTLSREQLVDMLVKDYQIAPDIAEGIASLSWLPFDGSKGSGYLPAVTLPLDGEIEISDAGKSPYLRDEETRARRLVERNDMVSSSVIINDLVDNFNKEFSIYDNSLLTMNRVRMFRERTDSYIFQVDEYFGVTRERIRPLAEHGIYGANEDGSVSLEKSVTGINKPFIMSAASEIKGPDGEVTARDREDVRRFQWALGALGTHKFQGLQGARREASKREGSTSFTLAELIATFYEDKNGGSGVFKTTEKTGAIRAFAFDRGERIWSRMTEEEKQERLELSGSERMAKYALGYNSFVDEAYQNAEILLGAAEAKYDSETKEYSLEDQTAKVSDWIDQWSRSKMKEKLEKAGRKQRLLQLNVVGKKGFRDLFWLEKQLALFHREAEELNELYEQMTGERLFYERFGYLMPQVSGGGWFSEAAMDWLDRRKSEIRDTAKNRTRFITETFSETRYDHITEDGKDFKPTPGQIEFYREIGGKAKQMDAAEDFIAADILIYNHLMSKLYKEARPDLGVFRKILTPTEEGVLDHFNKNILTQPAYQQAAGATKRRRFDTWLERFRKTGEAPRSLSPFEMLNEYSRDMHDSLQTRTILANAAITMDMDGRPAAFISLTKNYDPNHPYAPLPRSVLQRMITNMGQYLYREENTKEFLYNPAEDLVAQVRRIADHLNRNQVSSNKIQIFEREPKRGGMGYVRMNKRVYKGVEAVYGDRGVNADMIKKIADLPWEANFTFNDRRYDAFKGARDFAVMQKIARVSFSLFFPLAAVESQVGYYGQFKEVLTNPKGFFTTGFTRNGNYYMGLGQAKDALFNGHDPAFNHWLQEITAAGLMVDISHDYDAPIKYMDSILERIQKFAGRRTLKVAKTGVSAVESIFRWQRNYSNWLFGSIFPLLKVHAAHLLSVRAGQAYRELYGREWGHKEKMESYTAISRALNNGFGGQNWGQYTWATPKILQLMNFTVFAGNWTLSTANTMGAGILLNKLGLGPEVGSFEKRQMLLVNTLIMSIALVAWPNLLQAVIWAATRPFGDDEDEEAASKDVPFSLQNERTRRLHVDMTPLLRLMPWYQGAPTGDRRYYVRWGKQIYEVVDGWLVDPVGTFLAKTSMPVQMAISQITEHSPGSDFPLPFKDQGWLGWFVTPEEGFMGSRTANILSYWLPFSVPSLLKDDFDAGILPLFASVSKGRSAGAATRELRKIFQTYAMPSAWEQVSKNPTARENLRALGIGIIEAAERNGYPSDKIINSARGPVLGSLYLKMFEELERRPASPDQKELNKWARAILRVNGTVDGMRAHIDSKEKNFGNKVELTPEQEQALNEAFQNPAL